MPSKQYNVFISYSHKDGEVFSKKLAERINRDPRGGAISFWKDYDNLQYGQWSKQIEKAIDAVEFMIMVITPEALASPNCKDEWMYARKTGVCILPVNGLPDNINFYKIFPKWLQKHHIYNLEKHWDRFINDLNTRCQVTPVPFMAPRLSTRPDYVARKEELSNLKNLLLNGNNSNTVGITASLQGSGGFGKTTLAIALCNDDDIINDFDDGILWVTLGQQAGTARDALHKLFRGLSRDETSFIDVEEAQQKLAEKIDKRNCLVVIDDVWKAQDLNQILDSLGKCTVLITTRFAHILPQQNVRTVKVGEMKKSESIDLLTGKFRDDVQNIQVFEKLAKELGHWPLLLKLAAAQINEHVVEGEKPEQACAFVQEKYKRKGITGFDYDDASQRNDSVKQSLEASIELLKSEEKEKLLQLGMFPNYEIIPYGMISLLWQLDDFDTEDILNKFHKYGLVDLDFINKICGIHDVLLNYYKEQTGETITSALHESLVRSLGDFRAFKSRYAWKWYLWHLKHAGKMDTVTHLLQSFDWIEAKLFATNVTELLNDYESFSLDVNTDLIYRALKLSAHVLAEDKYQLPAQLIGRLGYFENEPVIQLLDEVKMWKKMAWLRPVTPCLTAPGVLSSILKGHTNSISALLVLDNKIISGSFDSSIRIWEIGSGQCLQTLEGHTGWIRSLLVLYNKIISGSDDNTIRIWDIESGKCLLILQQHEGGIGSLLVNDNKIISGSDDCTIRIWDMESGQCFRTLRGHKRGISSLSVHDNKIISASDDSTIRIWDIATGKCLQTLHKHTSWISLLQVNDNKIISGSSDNTIRIWEIRSGKCLHTLTGHTDWITSLLVQGNKIISGSKDSTIRIWDIESGQCLQTLQLHKDWISSLLVHDNKIISGSDDRTIRIWDLPSGRCLQTLTGHTGWISALLVQGDKIISGSSDSTIRIWDIQADQRLQIQQGHTDSIGALLFHEGKIISGSDDGTIRIWEIPSGRCLQKLEGHKGWVMALLVQEDKIISGSSDNTIRIWELTSGHCLKTMEEHTDWISSLSVLDNKIISGSDDSTIRIWEMESGKCLQKLEGHTDWISSLLLLKDKIISGSDDKTIRIWELCSGRCLHTLKGHTGGIRSLLAHGNKIISGSDDSTIRAWNLESGQCLQTFLGHTAPVRSLLVHDNKIVSGSDDGTIRIWELASGQCLQILKGHTSAIRSLLISDNKLISTNLLGLIIVYDIKMLTEISKYYSDAEYTSPIVCDHNRIISGDRSGQLHILEMVG